MDEGLTTIMTILGPLVLLGVIVWAITHNRSRVSKSRTEQATDANYKAEDRAAKQEEGR